MFTDVNVFDSLRNSISIFANCQNYIDSQVKQLIWNLNPLVDEMELAASTGNMAAFGSIINRSSTQLSQLNQYLSFQPFIGGISKLLTLNQNILSKFQAGTVNKRDVMEHLATVELILRGVAKYC